MGAWIEMPMIAVLAAASTVAPLVGAWIEILSACLIHQYPPSLLSWERGLKFCVINSPTVILIVAPLVGAWIEMISPVPCHPVVLCRSSRGSVD